MLDSFGRQDSTTRIIRLETHAAVRLSEVSDDNYDCYDLPTEKNKGATHKGSSFGKKMRTLASYLTVRINPAFQECHVVVVESMQGLAMEVRSVGTVRGQGGGSSDRLLYTAPMATLLDVSTDSVIEKDNVVFTQLPDSFSPGSESSSVLKPVVTEKATPKKGEIISTLFSAYGDIGLSLTFRAPRAGARSGRPLTKLVLRFVSTTERNTWMSFCMEAYVGLLLDSVRRGEERICPAAAVTAAAQAAGVQQRGGRSAAVSPVPQARELERPPRDAVERYIDFFLSGGKGSGGGASGASDDHRLDDAEGSVWEGSASGEPPSDGLIRVSENGTREHAHLRRLNRTKRIVSDSSHNRDPATPDNGNGSVRYIECLLIQKAKNSQRMKKGSLTSELWLPLDSFAVYAEDDEHGDAFCLEVQSATGDAVGAAKGVPGATGLLGNLTLELFAESHSERQKWLRWFETVLAKPVLYLSQARQEAETEKALAAKSKNRFLGRDADW